RDRAIELRLLGRVRGDRRADELGRDDARRRPARARVQIGHPERVHVAAEQHGIAGAALAERIEQALPRGRIAVPAVGPVALGAPGPEVEPRHARLLRDQVPARPAGRQARAQPLLLLAAEQRERSIEALAAIGTHDARATSAGRGAWLGITVLA